MSRTILIVDDNDIERGILSELLKNEYDIVTAESGKEMVSVLRERGKSISAILLDLVMPEMDGFEALRRIRENAVYRQIPVIVTTGLSDVQSQVKAMSLGANGYVFKPFNKDLISYMLKNAIDMHEKSAIVNTFRKDTLTGLLNRTRFFEIAEDMIKYKKCGYYILACIDIENFKIINDQYGIKTGDKVLKHVADSINKSMLLINGICCRYSADKFGLLYPAEFKDSDAIKNLHEEMSSSEYTGRGIKTRIGRYLVDDLTVPISAMFDRATLAEESIRGRYDIYIAEYTDSMRIHLLHEQKIVNDMNKALTDGEFEPWFQPQYNHATGALIGAEALVRWKKDGKYIPPAEFIAVFERNGFIYEMDQYIWEQVCRLMRRWIDEGYPSLPVSVNVSRRDLFHKHFIETFTDIVKKYDIPFNLLRIEVTESAFSESSGQIIAKVGELINLGFVVEIDDFGSGYSSLNTLKDVPASILKLDMKFFENTENQQRGGNIIESVVRMSKWLGMAVIAEGVEDKAQADYLKSIGCYYIQGYYYAKPMPIDDYEKLLSSSDRETELTKLKTLETLDNSEFWNPKSMETLIFNSYVGGACIFEYNNKKSELLRVNEQYTHELGGLVAEGAQMKESSLVRFLDRENKDILLGAMHRAIETQKESSCEVKLAEKNHIEYIRVTMRMIARAAERYLFYSVILNMTEQRDAEKKQAESARQLEVIMSNINGGVSAIQINDDGTSRFVFNNDKYYELYGYTKEQAESENLDVMSAIVAEDFDEVMTKVKKLKKDKQPALIDYRITKRDGSRALLRANASLMSVPNYGDDVITSVVTDITEKRSLEDQLKAIVANIYGGVTATIIRNGKPEFVIVNDRFFNMLGYATREEYDLACGDDKYACIHPDDKERIIQQFESSDGGKKHYTMEYRVIRKDGSVGYICNNISVIELFGVDGPVQLSVANDVTEVRTAELKERNLSLQIRAIMSHIRGGIAATLFHDKSNVEIIFSNDGFYEMYGYTKEQIQAEVPNMLDLILPEDRIKVMEIVERVVRDRSSETYEYRCRKRNGETVWVQCTNSVVSLEGVGDTVLLAVITDITSLRSAQQRENETADKLSAVLNHAGNGITAMTMNADSSKFLFINDRYFEIIGYTREEYLKETEKDKFAVVHPEDREKLRAEVTDTNRGKSNLTVEYRVIRKDGKTVWVRSVITSTYFKGVDEPVQIAVFSDITAEKEANDQLRFLNDSAHDILAQPDGEQAINDILQKLLTYFAADRGYVVELDYAKKVSSNTYEICSEGVSSEAANLQSIPFGTDDFWFEALSKDKYFIVDDVNRLKSGEKMLYELLSKQGIKTMILAPLLREGLLFGFVGVDNPSRAMDQIERLTALADYISILITRRDLNRKIEHDNSAMQLMMNDTPGGFVRMKLSSEKTFIPVYSNEGFRKMVGMDQKELHSIYGNDVLNGVHPDDRGIVRSAGEKMLANGEAESARFRVKNGNGEYIWLTLYGRVTKDVSGDIYLNIYYSDASKEMNEEQKQRELLDNLPCGAALYEYDGKDLSVIHINKSYWELVGREPTDYSEASVFGVIHPDDKQIVYQEIAAAIRQNRKIEVNIRIKCGNGEYRPFALTQNLWQKRTANIFSSRHIRLFLTTICLFRKCFLSLFRQ